MLLHRGRRTRQRDAAIKLADIYLTGNGGFDADPQSAPLWLDGYAARSGSC